MMIKQRRRLAVVIAVAGLAAALAVLCTPECRNTK